MKIVHSVLVCQGSWARPSTYHWEELHSHNTQLCYLSYLSWNYPLWRAAMFHCFVNVLTFYYRKSLVFWKQCDFGGLTASYSECNQDAMICYDSIRPEFPLVWYINGKLIYKIWYELVVSETTILVIKNKVRWKIYSFPF